MFNRYTYGHDNPVLNVDLDGRNPAIDRRAEAAMQLVPGTKKAIDAYCRSGASSTCTIGLAGDFYIGGDLAVVLATK